MYDIARELSRQGFAIVPDFLPPDACTDLKAILEGLGGDDLVISKDHDFHGGNTALAPNILIHDNKFISLAQDQRILALASHYFEQGTFPGEKNPFQLHVMHARMVDQNAPEQELHIDSRLCGVDPPLVLHIFLYLDDCLDNGSGATRIVPGSHRFHRYSQPADNERAISVYGRKGTAIFLNSNTFHGSSRKTTPGRRWLLTLAYSRWWVRQPFAIPYFNGWPRALTDAEKVLFGFNNYGEKNRSQRGLASRGPRPTLLPSD